MVRIQDAYFWVPRLGDVGSGSFPFTADVAYANKTEAEAAGFPVRPFLLSGSPPPGDAVVGIRWLCRGRVYWWARQMESDQHAGWRPVGDPLRSSPAGWCRWIG